MVLERWYDIPYPFSFDHFENFYERKNDWLFYLLK
jgi:hypothetical protein